MWPLSISHWSMTKIMWPFSISHWLRRIYYVNTSWYFSRPAWDVLDLTFSIIVSLCHELNTWSSTSSDHTSLLEHWRQLGKLLDGGLGLGVLVQLHLHLLLLDLQRDRGDLVSKDSCLCSCSPSLLRSKSKGITVFPEELGSKSCCHKSTVMVWSS